MFGSVRVFLVIKILLPSPLDDLVHNLYGIGQRKLFNR